MLIRLFRIVQFSRSFPPPFRATLLLYHISATLSSTFSKLFEIFFPTASCDPALSNSLYIVSLSWSFVKRFFKLFWKNLSRSDIFRRAYLSATAYILYHIPYRKSTPFATKYCTIWFDNLSTNFTLSTSNPQTKYYLPPARENPPAVTPSEPYYIVSLSKAA